MQREDGDGGEDTGKAPLPKSSWKGEGLKSIKTVNKGSAESETLQLNTWECSGGKGKFPGAEWGPGGSWATQGEAVPLLEEHSVKAVRPPGLSRPQRTATLAAAGTRALGVKPGARCVL